MSGPMFSLPVNEEPPELCGSYGGYQRHGRLNEEPCQPCREANAKYIREYRRQSGPLARHRADQTARRRAHQALAKRYPGEYQELFCSELAKLTDTP